MDDENLDPRMIFNLLTKHFLILFFSISIEELRKEIIP